MFSPRNVTREINFSTLDGFFANGAFVVISIFGYLSFLKFIVHFSNWQIKIRIFEQKNMFPPREIFYLCHLKRETKMNNNWFKTYSDGWKFDIRKAQIDLANQVRLRGQFSRNLKVAFLNDGEHGKPQPIKNLMQDEIGTHL